LSILSFFLSLSPQVVALDSPPVEFDEDDSLTHGGRSPGTPYPGSPLSSSRAFDQNVAPSPISLSFCKKERVN